MGLLFLVRFDSMRQALAEVKAFGSEETDRRTLLKAVALSNGLGAYRNVLSSSGCVTEVRPFP